MKASFNKVGSAEAILAPMSTETIIAKEADGFAIQPRPGI
ncbi:MAG: hypothetical protein JWO78_1905 [Micavibrio sp.]|nr:hypothetical protein [Micavibrio sp.]